MPLKITKKAFLEALENNEEGLRNNELAARMGISIDYFYKLKRQHKNLITNYARDMARASAMDAIQALNRNMRSGDTSAATRILEIAEVHVPRTRSEITGRDGAPIGIEVTVRGIDFAGPKD